MSIDILGLSAKELASLISKAKQQQSKLSKRTPIAAVRGRILKFVKAEGYTIEELFGTAGKPKAGRKAAKSTARAGRKVAPKYRNPANRKETWTGRGRQPRWMAALVAKGRKVEDFLIKKK